MPLPRIRLLTGGSDAGVSLIEVVAALAVFSSVTAAMIPLINGSVSLSLTNRQRVTAANLGEQHLEYLRRTDLSDPPLGVTTKGVDVDGIPYTLTQDVRWVSQTATAGACGAPPAPAYLRADISILWPGGSTPVLTSTLIQPRTAAAATPGSIAVRVTTRAGAPASGHVVRLSFPDGSSVTATTGSDGCATFSQLAVGTTAYRGSLATSGYVDSLGNPTPSQSMSLTTVAPTALWAVTYDVA